MDGRQGARCTAFEGTRRIASGALGEVALATKAVVERGPTGPVLVFDDDTSEPIELDLRGSDEDVLRRLAPPPPPAEEPKATRGPGRPRLGVVAREVTLLPRHWEWLAAQPGGASVALRRLVDEARRDREPADRLRAAREAAYRFMSAMAGDAPGFEEATRALFAGDRVRFTAQTADWPSDVRDHARRLAAAAFDA
ncbi:DUF2239 family protein [Gemmatirosa kalamazoonensis]|nr:DUF2239 family protein [Gemmatirosa kalamazoonensis]